MSSPNNDIRILVSGNFVESFIYIFVECFYTRGNSFGVMTHGISEGKMKRTKKNKTT